VSVLASDIYCKRLETKLFTVEIIFENHTLRNIIFIFGGGQIQTLAMLDQVISNLSHHLYDQAMLCFLKILQVNPDNTAAHTNLGRVYQEKKLLDPAEAEYLHL